MYRTSVKQSLSVLALAALAGCGAAAVSNVPGPPPQAAIRKSPASMAFAYQQLGAKGNGPIAFGPAGVVYVDVSSLCWNYSTYYTCKHSIARVDANGKLSLIPNLWCTGKPAGADRYCVAASQLLAPPDGSLWIARGSLFRVPPGKFSSAAMQQLPSAYGDVQAMAADSAGHVWLISITKHDRLELLATTVRDPDTFTKVALPACSQSDGETYSLAYLSGVLYVSARSVWTVPSSGIASCLANAPSNFSPTGNFAQNGNAILIGNSSGGLYSISGGQVSSIPEPQQNGQTVVPMTLAAANGTVYFTFDASPDPHVFPQNPGIEAYSNGAFVYADLGHDVGSVATSPTGALYISASCNWGCLGRLSSGTYARYMQR